MISFKPLERGNGKSVPPQRHIFLKKGRTKTTSQAATIPDQLGLGQGTCLWQFGQVRSRYSLVFLFSLLLDKPLGQHLFAYF